MMDVAALSPPLKDTMSPQERRSTDLMKTSVPLPFMLTIIAMVVAIAAGVWRIDARVSVIDARLDARERYDENLKAANQLYLDQLAKNLEAQITIAGLRNSLLSQLQDPIKSQTKGR